MSVTTRSLLPTVIGMEVSNGHLHRRGACRRDRSRSGFH